MAEEVEVYQGKSVGELGSELLRFCIHTVVALAVVGAIMLIGQMLHADPDAVNPKLIAMVLSFVLPLVLGFAVMKVRPDYVARYVWISGVVLFAVVCVWVLDLPTGNGLCERCGAVDKLTRTFFSIQNGSGLAGGWGLVLGCWGPLSLFGYAFGAHLALGREPEIVD